MGRERSGRGGPGVSWFVLWGLSLAFTGCLYSDALEPDPQPLSPSRFIERTELPSLTPEEPLAPGGGGEDSGAARETEEVRVIDLATALEIGGASSLQVAFAREQLAEANARLDEAKVLWLPNLWAGGFYNKHEGNIQEIEGAILDVSRNAGFVGAGLFASFNLADAFLEPRSAFQEMGAASAGVTASVNDTLLGIALSYNDLLEAQASLTLAKENVSIAEDLVQLTEAFSQSGQGLEADAARARSERARRKRLTVAAEQSVETLSARLATLLRLDPTVSLRASEPQLVPFLLIEEDAELDHLIELAMDSRPEIHTRASTVRAMEEDERQETLQPFIPRIELGLRGGGLGGGTGSDFEDFDGEGELTAGLVWEVRNLGFGESASRRRQAARTRRAKIQLEMVRDSVSEQVTVAYLQAREGRRQVELAMQNVEDSLQSLDLNLQRIHAAEGLPIEALQAFQASATARDAYLTSVGEFNRSQLLLLRAVGATSGLPSSGRR